MKTNILADFQVCISVPLRCRYSYLLIIRIVGEEWKHEVGLQATANICGQMFQNYDSNCYCELKVNLRYALMIK